MKYCALVVVALSVLLLAYPATADHIGIYADTQGTFCSLDPPAFAPFSVYVVHIYTFGASASSFKVDDQSGLTHLGYGLINDGISLGDPWTGIDVAYGGCYFGHVAVARLDYFGFPVPAVPCGQLRIVPSPWNATILAYDCDPEPHSATGGTFTFGSSNCETCSTNPAEPTSWGRLKALYRK